MKFNQRSTIVHSGNRTIVSNNENGRWLKIPRQCYDIFKWAEDNTVSLEDLLKKYDEEDKLYLSKIYDKLTQLGVLNAFNETDVSKSISLISISLTKRCNLRCLHCGISAFDEHADTDLSYAMMLETIAKVVKLNPKCICFTGGEPLLRKDFKELLEFTKSIHTGIISLMTNGVLINKDMAEYLVGKVDQVDISIDGYDEESCEKIRGKGVFGKVIRAIDYLQESGLNRITLSLTEIKRSKEVRNKFNSLCARLKVEPVIRMFAPTGRGESLRKEIVYDEQKIIPSNFNISKKDIRNVLKCFKCGAGQRAFQIEYNGSIYPCGVLTLKEEYKFGNILEIEDFGEFIDGLESSNNNGYKNFKSILPTNYSRCKDCDINIFCWDCLQEICYIGEYSQNFENMCKTRKKHLRSLIWGD